jgi:hypothetical protein
LACLRSGSRPSLAGDADVTNGGRSRIFSTCTLAELFGRWRPFSRPFHTHPCPASAPKSKTRNVTTNSKAVASYFKNGTGCSFTLPHGPHAKRISFHLSFRTFPCSGHPHPGLSS